ncbi:guanine nucleotide-binding subunit beta [Raphidocelis subcapitata]|uniref:Guanine nucleotide-binding subunit beta n=1 Tax=Raphidocelis subcapitata TaxID=307507 RepID=A0A2V0PFL4_9CHLO|nr:guanine nucleotide-binding subunit beta [Raphidocelis subcapitata]|eukprot:GBF95997.1 guanine nucleotide-binding subunit beta [Raphidocelis subcapitata]
MPQPSPDPAFVLRGHRADVQCLAFSRDGRDLWSGDADGEVRRWDLDERRPSLARRLHGADAGVLQLAVAQLPGGEALVTQGRDGVVRCWRVLPDGALPAEPSAALECGGYNFCRFSLLQQPGAGAPPSAAVPAGDAQRDGPAEAGGTGRAADALQRQQPTSEADEQQREGQPRGGQADDREPPRQLRQQQPRQQQPSESEPPDRGAGPGAPLLAAPCSDAATIGVWELAATPANAQPQLRLEQARPKGTPQRGMAMALALFSGAAGGGAPHVLAGYENGAVALWDGRAPGQPLAEAQLHSEPAMALALGPAGAVGPAAGGGAGAGAAPLCAVSGSADSALAFFSVDAAAGALRVTASRQLPSPGVGDVAVRGDGRVVASAHWDGRVRLWHARRAAPLGVLRYHSKSAAAVAFCGAGDMALASGGRDGAVALWRVFPAEGGQGGGDSGGGWAGGEG